MATFITDGVRIFPTKKIFVGKKVKKLDLSKDIPWMEKDSQQYKDIERFAWFSNNFLALDPNNPSHIVDIRYSMLPNEISGLWGIEVNKEAMRDDHIRYITKRSLSKQKFKDLLIMLKKD